jgi:hypothetical protein
LTVSVQTVSVHIALGGAAIGNRRSLAHFPPVPISIVPPGSHPNVNDMAEPSTGVVLEF